VHLAALGHPVLGDKVYGRRRSSRAAPAALSCARQALHAEELRFAHPVSGAPIVVRAALPNDLEELLASLRRDACNVPKSRHPLDR
jgi:23S rRNA pseudouridine1911/1915/1917 synthase